MSTATSDFMPPEPWIKGTLASIAAHVAVVLPFFIPLIYQQPETQTAAVMVEYAPELTIALITHNQPIGINQQRKAQATREDTSQQLEEKISLPVTPSGEWQTAKPAESKPVKKSEPKPLKSRHMQQEEKGNSTTTSRAAPPTQRVARTQTRAPVDMDATAQNTLQLNWQSLVKGKINRMRNYPEDARKRKRSGTAVVTFTVNSDGDIVASQLVNSSGTLSLDRAALQAVLKAQPLPKPPAEILRNGMHKVTLPVEFNLLII